MKTANPAPRLFVLTSVLLLAGCSTQQIARTWVDPATITNQAKYGLEP